MATALEKATVWSWCDEPVERAPIRSTDATYEVNAERFTATGAGTPTTIVSTALTVASALGYVGCIMKCVGAALPDNVGLDCEVLAFNPGTDTPTVAGGFYSATANGDQFETYTPPDPIVVQSSATGETTIVRSSRRVTSVETNDFWNGYYLQAENVANTPRGTPVLINDFAAATGDFTVPTIGVVAVGDLWKIRKYPKLLGPPTVEYPDEDLERPATRADCGEEQSPKGSRSWKVSNVIIPLKGSGTAAGDGTAGVPNGELHPAMRAVMETKISTGDAVVAAAGTAPALSTTSFNVATGGLANFAVGTPCHDNAGRVAIIVASAANGGDPDSFTVRPALNRAPIAGEVMRGGVSWGPMMTGHRTMTWDLILGGKKRFLGYGGVPDWELIDIGKGQLPKWSATYQGGYHLTYPLDTPSPLVPQQDTLVPKHAGDAYLFFVLEGENTIHRVICNGGKISAGNVLVEEPGVTLPDGHYGYRIVDNKPRMTATVQLDTSGANDTYKFFNWYKASRVFSVFWQHHQVPGRTVFCYAHRAEFMSPGWGVADGLLTQELRIKFLASNLTGMPKFVWGTT